MLYIEVILFQNLKNRRQLNECINTSYFIGQYLFCYKTEKKKKPLPVFVYLVFYRNLLNNLILIFTMDAYFKKF